MVPDNKKYILSIIIPVFNRQEPFNRLIENLSRAITHDNLEDQIEIIVIDDASDIPITLPDAPCHLYAERNKKNSGAPFSRKRGLELSRGKFIHFHDSDDSISDTWLADLMIELSSKPDIDLLVTGRIDFDLQGKTPRFPKFFNNHAQTPARVLSRLLYWNCIGPIGGVTFSRRILNTIRIKKMASCQDWQMYVDAIKNAKVLSSRADIQFLFIKTGDDRISHNPRKKILGHLQLARETQKSSVFGRNIRLFYLYACKQYIHTQGGSIMKFYKNHQTKIFITFIIIAAYSFMPRFKK